MKLFGLDIARATPAEARASIENPTVPVSAENFLQFFGIESSNLPNVTVERALTVPAFLAGVTFLSRTLAAPPLGSFIKSTKGAKKVDDGIARLLSEAPNSETTSFAWRQHFWQQVFTGGRGLSWIERAGDKPVAIWPMDPKKATVIRDAKGRKLYKYQGKSEPYPASDVIDLPFMLREDGLRHWGPVSRGARALQLAIALNEYGAQLFAGGGVPPLVLVGPMGTGPEAQDRAHDDILRAVDRAKKNNKPIVSIPFGYELKPIGIDVSKGLVVEGQKFQVIECARLLNLPPLFVGDLTTGTFTNTEQQDLHLVKHLLMQWATAFEQEINLKLMPGRRYAKHNLNAIMRGDLKSRTEAIARAIQTAQLTPDEGRELEDRPAYEGGLGAKPYIQGATVPLGTQPVMTPPTKAEDDDGGADDPGS